MTIMKLYIKRILILFILLSSLKSNAQDPHFSQFYSNPMYLNHAITGTRKAKGDQFN